MESQALQLSQKSESKFHFQRRKWKEVQTGIQWDQTLSARAWESVNEIDLNWRQTWEAEVQHERIIPCA